jgi:hypothetical protein
MQSLSRRLPSSHLLPLHLVMDHLPPPEELDRIALERVRSEGAYDACRQRALHALRNNVSTAWA